MCFKKKKTIYVHYHNKGNISKFYIFLNTVPKKKHCGDVIFFFFCKTCLDISNISISR